MGELQTVLSRGSLTTCAQPVTGRRKALRPVEEAPAIPKEQWTMPPLALLGRPQMSTARRIAMLTLSGYLALAVILLIVKAIQLGTS